jgi:PAS domain S-box-containing protein
MPRKERVSGAANTLLILIPEGRNAEGAAALLTQSGVACRVCPSFDLLYSGIGEDTGAVLVAGEALTKIHLKVLTDRLGTQSAWSDLPFIVLTRSDNAARRLMAEMRLPEALGNVVFLEYPLNALSLVAAARSALRARQRQRQMGVYLAEQHTAADALRESEARFRHMADSVPALIWMTDATGKVVFVNMHHGHMFGRPVADIVQQGWTAIVVPEAQRQFRAAFSAAFQDRATFSTETQVHDKAGRVRWLRCDGVPRLDDIGRFLGYTGCAVDITDTRLATQELERHVAERTEDLSAALEQLNAQVREREQVEKALRQSQKMEAIGQLTGGIAHDFNNMLQGILGCLDLIERRLEQGRVPEIAPYVQAARRSLSSAAALTHRLLAFGRRQTLLPRPIEPDRLVQGMEELIRRTVGPAISVMVRLRDGVWRVKSDSNQLENALLNLCINARDAMPDGGTLTIRTADRVITTRDLRGQDDAKPGRYVEMCVSDTGMGMTPDVQARAFEPFFTTKPIGQGTGLGLSQLYGFVQQSGGFVRLQSELGSGTTVSLYLPWHDDMDEAPAKAQPDIEARTSAEIELLVTNGQTVLVVEDESDVRNQITQALRDLDYRVVEAADGNVGLRVVQSPVSIDLLVTDVGLPGLNGRQLADAARVRRPDLPVLLITGYPGKALANTGIPRGMAVMGKPFTLEALTARVRAMLRAPRSEVQ